MMSKIGAVCDCARTWCRRLGRLSGKSTIGGEGILN
jgi:hypothetical protein